MNILYLNNSVHLGGDTKCILKLSKEFSKKNNVSIASEGGILEKEFREINTTHFKINDVENKRPNNIISNILKIRKIIKENNIHIIHSHHRMTTLIAKLAVKFTKAKVVHTQHLCITNKFLLTRVALANTRIITVSNGAKDILIEKAHLKSNNITTIYNTIETNIVKSCKKIDSRLLNLKKDGYFVVAQVSRIISYKGIYDFVDIAEKVVEKNDKIRFVFLGDGPEKEEMNKYVEEKQMSDFIFLLGAKDNVLEHLKYIDVMLLCSYVEGLPLTPIEAFFNKIPVIATNIEGTKEEIINDINGYLLDVKDIHGFANKIQLLYENEQMLIKLKNNAYNTFLDNFNEEKYIHCHKKLYEEIIKNI